MPQSLRASWSTDEAREELSQRSRCARDVALSPTPLQTGAVFTEGELVELTFREHRYRVTATDLRWLPELREYLIEAARRRQTVTYGRLKADVGLPHAVNGLGRLLDLLSEDCFRRRPAEPSLASLVVAGSTGEVGEQFFGDAAAARAAVYAHWRAET